MKNLDVRSGYEEAFMNLLSNPKYIDLSFYSFIIAKMEVSFNKLVPTAGAGFANNNYQLLINPDFFNNLPLEQRMGVLVHECLHVILKHIFRKGERNHQLFNVAADIALNQSIKKDMLPEGALYPDTFQFKANLTAEQYYELLKEEKKKQEQEKKEWQEQNQGNEPEECDNCGGTGKEPDDGENGDKEDQGAGGDQEGETGENGEQEGEGQGECSDQGDKPCSCCGGTGEKPGTGWPGPANGNPDLTQNKEITLDSHEAWDNITEEEEELASQMMEKMIENAIEKSRGNTPGNLEQIMDLWRRPPKISWKKVLKRFVSSKIGSRENTIKRRDRRQPNRLEVKGKKVSYDKPNIIVGIDTSGSMSDEEIVNGLIEINEVCKITHSTLQVVQIDTQINGVEEYDPKKKTFKRRGCGGTYMGAMAQYLYDNKVKYDALVMISDMYIEDVSSDKNWKRLKKPTLWLNTSGTEVEWAGIRGHTVMDIAKA